MINRITPLLLFIGLAWGQKEYNINHIVEQDSVYKKKFSDKIVNGNVYQMSDDMKVPLGKMKNGKKDGLWTGWDDNGQKMYDGTFKNGELLSYIAYLENGTIGWDTEKINVIDTIKYDWVCGGVQRRWLSE